jgi:excisionase family DNA binding protein
MLAVRVPNLEAPTVGVPEAALLVGCSAETIRGLVHSGRLVAHRVGHRFRVTRQSLRDYMQSNRVGNPAEGAV